MEIKDPEEIKINNKTAQVLQLTAERISDFNKKEFSSEQIKLLKEALIEPQIRISLAIEGIDLRERQTTEILKVYKTTGEIKHTNHAEEAVNLAKAIDFISSDEIKKETLSAALILEVNKIVENNILPDAGRFRNQNVRITGASITPPDYTKINDLLEDVAIYFQASEQQDPILLSLWLHHVITQIHPFLDGNGRTARLMQDWVLLRRGYFAVSTGHLERSRYMDLLEDADDDEWNDLISSMAEAQSDVISRAIQAVEAPEIQEISIGEIVRASKSRRNSSLVQEYDQWRHHMQRVVEAFEQYCKRFNEEAGVKGKSDMWESTVSCGFIPNPMIDAAKWERIGNEGTDFFNKAFLIWWNREGTGFYKTEAYFARHFPRPKFDPELKESLDKKVSLYMGGWDLPPEVDSPKAAMLLRSQQGKVFAQLPWPDPLISLREIMIGGSDIYKYECIPQGINVSDKEGVEQVYEEREHEVWIPTIESPSKIVSEYATNLYSKKTDLGSS